MWSDPLSSCHQLSDQPAAWQAYILSHGWGNCRWQANWLTAYWTTHQPALPLGRDILWPSVWLLWSCRPVVSCYPSPVDISWQSLVSLLGRMTFVRYIPRQRILWPSALQLWSGWPLVTCTAHPKIRLWFRLAFVQASGHADLSLDIPPRHLVAKCDTTSGHCSEKPHFVFICWDN